MTPLSTISGPMRFFYGVTIYNTARLWGESLAPVLAANHEEATAKACGRYSFLVTRSDFIRIEVYRI